MSQDLAHGTAQLSINSRFFTDMAWSVSSNPWDLGHIYVANIKNSFN